MHNEYTFTLRHDNGLAKVRVRSKDISSAIALVCEIELCPERAIENIKIKYHD